jgi:hypothetical protein
MAVAATTDFWRVFANALIVFGQREALSVHLVSTGINIVMPRFGVDPPVEYGWQELHQLLETLGRKIESIIDDYQVYKNRRIYVPTMRGANSLFGPQKLKEDIYAHSIRINYKLESKDFIDVFTGLKLYDTLKRLRHSKINTRIEVERFEKFLSVNFFEGRKVDLIPLESDSNTEQHISFHVEGLGEADLHNLGDGIQALIVMLFPIFTAPEGTFVFIEEPEINLHPGFQRIFVDTILNHVDLSAKNLKIFITTHSNHMVNVLSDRTDSDASYFLFKWIDSSKSEIKIIGARDTEILRQLGVSNSSVFMAKCSIWVEGITDRIYIKSYMQAYNKAHPLDKLLIEDMDYTFVEYGGSNIAHYDFNQTDCDATQDETIIKSLTISNRIVLVSDLDGSNKESKHQKFRKIINDNFLYITTPGYEIENTLSENLLANGFNKIANVKPEEEDIIFESYDRYSSTEDPKPIGRFIKPGNKKKFEKYFESGGTLKPYYKRRFCEAATKDMLWENMSIESQSMTRAILEFIRSSI